MEVFDFYLKNFISQLVERPTGKKRGSISIKDNPKANLLSKNLESGDFPTTRTIIHNHILLYVIKIFKIMKMIYNSIKNLQNIHIYIYIYKMLKENKENMLPEHS